MFNELLVLFYSELLEMTLADMLGAVIFVYLVLLAVFSVELFDDNVLFSADAFNVEMLLVEVLDIWLGVLLLYCGTVPF